MKQFKLAAALMLVSVSLFSSTTFAHTTYKGDVLSSSPYNWTGLYVGLNAGLVKHSMDITDSDGTTFNATIHQVSNPQLTGGFQIGYRRQLDLTKASGVYGLEFSTNFANATADQTYGSSFSLFQLDSTSKLRNLALLELIGGIAADRTLLFLSAGLSWANISGKVTNVATIPFFNSFSLEKNALGTAVGAGIEYAFSEKISARFKVDVATPNVYSTHDNLDDGFQISNNIVQATVGINYKLG